MIKEEPDYTEKLSVVHDIVINLISTFGSCLPDRIGIIETAKLTLYDITKEKCKRIGHEQYIRDKKKIDEAREDQK